MKDEGPKQWGGPRTAGPGKKMGRPPAEDGAKVALSLRVPAEVREYLQTTGNISEAVAEIVSRTKAFRDWRQHNGT